MLILSLILTALHASPVASPCTLSLTTERWSADGLSTLAYEFDFAHLFTQLGEDGPGSFARTIDLARWWYGTVNVLDLFGSGLVFTSATSVTGLRLAPLDARESERARMPTQVHGSAFRDATWAELDRSRAERGLGDFDLVVMRPLGGWTDWDGGKDELAAFVTIIDQTLTRLAPGGRFYFAIWSSLAGAGVRHALERLRPGFGDRYDFAHTEGTFPLAGVISDRRARPGRRDLSLHAAELSFAEELQLLNR